MSSSTGTPVAHSASADAGRLTPTQRRIAESFARAIIAAGRVFPAAGARTVERAERMPTPPAVNQPITIMAMADRAAGRIAERLA